MARKAPAKAPRRPAAKAVRLDMDPEAHQLLRVVAAAHGKPMAIYCRDLITSTVRAEHAKLTRKGSGKSVLG